jgi:hypothetical protein
MGLYFPAHKKRRRVLNSGQIVEGLLVNLFQQLSRLYAKTAGELDYVEQADISFATFKSPNVIAMQIRQFGKLFLR